MVEVFKTNVTDVEVANMLINVLHQYWPEALITFDLEDCDKVLRFEAQDFDSSLICDLLTISEISCEIMC